MKADLVEKTSKNGEKYICIEIALTPTYKKVVFLDSAEKEIVRNLIANSNAKSQ